MKHQCFGALPELSASDFGYGLGGFTSGGVLERSEFCAARRKEFNEFFKNIVYHFGLLLCRYLSEIRS
jgi:hypothetical protein